MRDGFVWNDNHSSNYGIICSSLPGKGTFERNIEKIEQQGRNGYLTIDHGTYKSDIRKVEFHLIDETKIDDIKSWLSGAGEVTFSNAPDRFYKATIISKVDLAQIIPTLHKGIIQFDCQPFGYLYQGNDIITLTKTQILFNPGTKESEPYIKIYGSGNIVLRINGLPLQINGVSGYVEIDTYMDSVYKNTVSMDNSSIGDTPILQPGENEVSWSGNITKIEITPRWRCL